ncbi:Plant phosphoribosyltransferase C-terminal [Musa troglodytarum]|uniref:Plant phosphoribosyltransferase C-terminal n=1 Tax=Musa troglodytarum TaxID=320322 RepID=A0A9E7KGY6_9LILI|nr:Plant phosphoribosyltransferase C-terminal [Musa troglodytarum]
MGGCLSIATINSAVCVLLVLHASIYSPALRNTCPTYPAVYRARRSPRSSVGPTGYPYGCLPIGLRTAAAILPFHEGESEKRHEGSGDTGTGKDDIEKAIKKETSLMLQLLQISTESTAGGVIRGSRASRRSSARKKNCSERLAEGKMASCGNLGTDLKGSLLIRVGYVRYSSCESIFHPFIVAAISKLAPFVPHHWVFVLPSVIFITGRLFFTSSLGIKLLQVLIEMSNYKLGVEVVSAHDLMPKDGQGSASPCVELQFDGQKFRTTIKEKDLNPVWNECFYFNIADPASLPELVLEASVYNMNRATHPRSCLGKVQIAGTSFVPYADAVVMHYPLEKHRIFSRVKGELGLKVFLTDDPSIKPSNPFPAIGPHSNDLPPSQAHQVPAQVSILNTSSPPENRSETRYTFHSVPKEVHQHHSSAPISEPVRYAADPMKPEPQPPRIVRMYSSASSQQPVDYALKETSPFLGGGQIVGGRVIRADKPASTYDLVEQMQYLFVRVVKAKDLPAMDVTGSLDPFVEVRVGNYKGTTKHFEKKQNPEWNEVFAFSRDQLQASVVEVVVKDKDLVKDDFVGMIRFDLNDVPTRVPPDSPLAPEWYRLEDKKGDKTKGELMLAVWIGTQADESFPDAWHSDAAAPVDGSAVGSHIRSKVYHAPRLWYVRVNVVEAQDIVMSDKTRFPDVYVKVQLGNQVLRTRAVQARTFNPLWNEDFMLVAAEPFEDHLILSVEDRVGPNKDEVIGRVIIPMGTIEKRADDRIIYGRWFSLEKPVAVDVDQLKKDKFSSRIHLRVCLDGGYHVLDESTHYSSDLRPTAKQLRKPSIGLLELGILNAEGLHPMKTREGKGTSDTYCVAKYGQKWVRTRTIINSLSPKYNEQYTWEVYDPDTVLTVGVFDNCQLGEKGSSGNKDAKIGKVRIRLSTLETGRVYTHSYPLLVLHPSGIKKMGELHLAIRFSSTSLINMLYTYSRPLLPKMHYIRPLTMMQQDMLRHQAVQIVAARLGRMEPPLRKEVVEYMSDVDSHLWSMRRSKANFFRLMSVFSGLFAVSKWFKDVCAWKNPITTVLVHILFLMLVCFPELVLPTVFLYMFMIGIWNYRYRPRYPPHMNIKISHAEVVQPDELDEEFDTFPTSKSAELVRMRYDRLRSVAGRIQTVVGDLATQGERVQALLSWRDPRATAIFVVFCLVAALVLYVTPLQVLIALAGFYVMRHPRFRHRMPSAPVNFFRRLPARTDSML